MVVGVVGRVAIKVGPKLLLALAPRTRLALKLVKATQKTPVLGVGALTILRIVGVETAKSKAVKFGVGKATKAIGIFVFEHATRPIVNLFLVKRFEVPDIKQASEQLEQAVEERRIMPLGGPVAAAFFGRRSVFEEIIRKALPSRRTRTAFEIFLLVTA